MHMYTYVHAQVWICNSLHCTCRGICSCTYVYWIHNPAQDSFAKWAEDSFAAVSAVPCVVVASAMFGLPRHVGYLRDRSYAYIHIYIYMHIWQQDINSIVKINVSKNIARRW